MPITLTKPLRPMWVTPELALPDPSTTTTTGPLLFDDYRPVICCTASRRVVGSEMDEAGYVQGAGDDTENWAHGLIPAVFWEHVDELLEAAEADLPELITRLVEQQYKGGEGERESSRKDITPVISVCALPLKKGKGSSNCCCYITITQDITPKDAWAKTPNSLDVGLGKSKMASRNMRAALPEICAFASKFLASEPPEGDTARRITVACESGKDLSVGVALALWCYLFDDSGHLRVSSAEHAFTKTFVKARLGSIMTTFPEANPSRSTLQSVNSFLMD
ncbi:hypothetical protein LRP88_12460 [Fusarium phalaenopsidis]